MKLKNAKGDVFDAPSSTGKALIAAGLATEVLPPPAALPIPRTTWEVVAEPYRMGDGVSYSPAFINAHCKTCGHYCQLAGPSAHRTQSFRHCRISERVPDHIAIEYEKILAKPRELADAKVDRKREQMKQGMSIPINW